MYLKFCLLKMFLKDMAVGGFFGIWTSGTTDTTAGLRTPACVQYLRGKTIEGSEQVWRASGEEMNKRIRSVCAGLTTLCYRDLFVNEL